jgi:hypothetical protein
MVFRNKLPENLGMQLCLVYVIFFVFLLLVELFADGVLITTTIL